MLLIMPKILQDKQQSIEVYGNHLFIECKIYTGQDIYTMFIFPKFHQEITYLRPQCRFPNGDTQSHHGDVRVRINHPGIKLFLVYPVCISVQFITMRPQTAVEYRFLLQL